MIDGTDQVLGILANDFAQHGQEILERVRREEPLGYLKIIVSIMPQELIAQFESFRPSEVSHLDTDELVELCECDETQKLAEMVYENEPPQVKRRR